MPRVTALIPNYNHAPFLEKRIRSVLEQTYRDIEVLFLDDGSSDASLEIFERYVGDPRVRTLYRTTNSGSPFKQWNRGVREANGEYIWIAESDDYADNGFLETLVPVLDANPQAGLAYCDSWIVDEQDRLQGAYFEQANISDWIDTNRWQGDFIASGRDHCAHFHVVLNTIPCANSVLLRKSVYERVGGADEDYVMAGDWLTWAKILSCSDVAFVARRLSYWRQHPNTVRSRLHLSGRDVEEAFRATVRFKRMLDLSPAELQVPNRKLQSLWFWRSWERFASIPPDRTWRIYRNARELDSRVLWHLVRVFAPILLRGAARRTRSFLKDGR